MYLKFTMQLAENAVVKIDFLNKNPLGFFMSTMMAGAYIGIGVIMIMVLGNEAEFASRKLIMGCFFGITLTLIIFAGAELFSGHILYMTFGVLHKKLKIFTVIKDWVICWYGNLFGAMLLSFLFILGGGAGLIGDGPSLVHEAASVKMNSTITELVARAILCNWLICLAIWMSNRTQNDVAKCILIFWCLFAFVAVGYEHGIANMTVFTIALLSNHSSDITIMGGVYNLLWVSFGNIIGGAGFIGVAYFLTNNNVFSNSK